MENHQITAAQISASSQYDANLPPTSGRLHFKGGYGSWATRVNDLHQWFQINLRVEANVTFVATQGRYDEPNQRVTQYKLQFSKDGLSFQFYKETGENSDKVSVGVGSIKYIQVKKSRKNLRKTLKTIFFSGNETET